MRLLFLILLQFCLFSADFDCIIVGTSPFSLFEALYLSHSGKKVLIVEESSTCGGAWKSIDICGIPHVDLGCHQIGHDLQLKAFLEEYAGCTIVSMDNPLVPFEPGKSPNGWYFARGCFELIDHLLQLISMTDIMLYNCCKVEAISIDASQKIAIVQTQKGIFTSNKVLVTPMSQLVLHPVSGSTNYRKLKYYHLYLLVQDPSPPHFSYRGSIGKEISRLMNLTYFAKLSDTGRQLIVIQTHREQNLTNGETYLDILKAHKLVDPAAYLLKAEPYIYEAGSFHQGLIPQIGAQGIIEVLQTGHLHGLSNYIPKWKKVLKPFY